MVEIRAQFLRFRDLTPFSSRLLNCIQSNLYKTGIIEYVCPQNYTPPHTHQQTKTKAVRDSLQKTLFTFMFLQGTPRKLYCTREPVYCKIFLGIVQMKNSFEYYIMSKYAQIIFEQFWFPYTIIYPKAPSFQGLILYPKFCEIDLSLQLEARISNVLQHGCTDYSPEKKKKLVTRSLHYQPLYHHLYELNPQATLNNQDSERSAAHPESYLNEPGQLTTAPKAP